MFFLSNELSTFYYTKQQKLKRQIEELKEENKLLIEKTKIVDIIQNEFSKRDIEYVFNHCNVEQIIIVFVLLM